MNKEQLRAGRQRLNKIYVEHDIAGFREFIKDLSMEKPELVPYIEETDEVLSRLMFTMKSGLMYLGPQWQEARNQLRYAQFWDDSGKSIEEIPKCMECKFFQAGPKGEDPCIQLGAVANDIACKSFDIACKPLDSTCKPLDIACKPFSKNADFLS
jgi:hypothetical protein